jgi:hypothetical protein
VQGNFQRLETQKYFFLRKIQNFKNLITLISRPALRGVEAANHAVLAPPERQPALVPGHGGGGAPAAARDGRRRGQTRRKKSEIGFWRIGREGWRRRQSPV